MLLFFDLSKYAGVVELVDTRDLKSLAPIVRTGSSPVSGTESLAYRAGLFFFLNTERISSYFWGQGPFKHKFMWRARRDFAIRYKARVA